MRVQQSPEDIGKCGCGRREYCDGSHGLSEAQWQAVVERERKAALEKDGETGQAAAESSDERA